MSRIYLGVHWRMDQEDGQALGLAVAQYVAAEFLHGGAGAGLRRVGGLRDWYAAARATVVAATVSQVLCANCPTKPAPREDLFLQRIDELDHVNRVEAHQDDTASRPGRDSCRSNSNISPLIRKLLKGVASLSVVTTTPRFGSVAGHFAKKFSPDFVRFDRPVASALPLVCELSAARLCRL